MRSQPRLGQRGESLGVYRKNWKGPAVENKGQREDHSKQRDPQSRKPVSVWWRHKVPLGGRAERSATRAGRSQDKELKKILKCSFKLDYSILGQKAFTCHNELLFLLPKEMMIII